jgi:hypothetical protein
VVGVEHQMVVAQATGSESSEDLLAGMMRHMRIPTAKNRQDCSGYGATMLQGVRWFITENAIMKSSGVAAHAGSDALIKGSTKSQMASNAKAH